MKTTPTRALLGVVIVLTAACADQSPAPTSSVATSALSRSAIAGPKVDGHGFGFNGTASGFPKGAVFLTGGGSYDPTTATNKEDAETDVHSGGGFRRGRGGDQEQSRIAQQPEAAAGAVRTCRGAEP